MVAVSVSKFSDWLLKFEFQDRTLCRRSWRWILGVERPVRYSRAFIFLSTTRVSALYAGLTACYKSNGKRQMWDIGCLESGPGA